MHKHSTKNIAKNGNFSDHENFYYFLGADWVKVHKENIIYF